MIIEAILFLKNQCSTFQFLGTLINILLDKLHCRFGDCDKFVNNCINYYSNKMGSQITVDKHTTGIDEWLDISDKLDSVTFELEVINHVSCWKFFNDELNPQQFNTLQIKIDIQTLHQVIYPHETYLVLVIKNENIEVSTTNNVAFSTLAHSLRQNIQKKSYQTPILSGKIDKYCYYVYTFLGKMAKSKIKLASLSYALKMNNLLDAKKKLSILSNGGVLQEKKLQKGSTIRLLNNVFSNNKEISEFQDIHIFTIFSPPKISGNFMTNFKSRQPSPFIECKQTLPKGLSIKPPLLKLSLKPFEEVKYEEIEQQQNSGQIKFDIRSTARHDLKMSKFEGECSQIVEGVYVSGERVAKSWQILQKYKIKTIVNCAGDYCQNWFQNKGMNYITFFLKDSQNQNIQCLFYIVIDFIENALRNKVNVLVHCIQGVSRSITLIIAYIIYKFGFDYKKAEQFVKEKRGIACPNNGFMVQLIQFHKRLYQDFNSLPIPRVFLVSAHSKQTPNIITARMIKQPLFDNRKYIGLDSRGIYIIQCKDVIYTWVGTNCVDKRLQKYWAYSQQFIKRLQRYEKGSLKIKAISQGTEGKEFFLWWNIEESPRKNYESPEYTKLFYEGEPTKPGGMRKFYEPQIQIEEQHINKLYIYPDYQLGLGVFEWEDLAQLNILVSSENQQLRVYICKKDTFIEEDEVIGMFLENVLKSNYENYQSDQIIIEEQNVDAPSQAFQACFS